LLVPSAISRIIGRSARRGRQPDSDEIGKRIDATAESLRNEVHDSYLEEFRARRRAAGAKAAARHARAMMAARYSTSERRLRACPGKLVLRDLRRWCQQRWGVSMTAGTIAAELEPREIDP